MNMSKSIIRRRQDPLCPFLVSDGKRCIHIALVSVAIDHTCFSVVKFL